MTKSSTRRRTPPRRLALDSRAAAHGEHEAQRATEDEADRRDQRGVGQQPGRHPDEARPVAARRRRTALPSRESRRCAASQTSQAPQSSQHDRRPPRAGSWGRRRRTRPRRRSACAPGQHSGRAERPRRPATVRSRSWLAMAPPRECGTGPPGARGLRAGRSDHPRLHHGRAQARELVVDEVLEVRPAISAGVQAFFSSASAQALRLGGLDDHLGRAPCAARRDARGAVDAAPVADHDVDALLLQRRAR